MCYPTHFIVGVQTCTRMSVVEYSQGCWQSHGGGATTIITSSDKLCMRILISSVAAAFQFEFLASSQTVEWRFLTTPESLVSSQENIYVQRKWFIPSATLLCFEYGQLAHQQNLEIFSKAEKKTKFHKLSRIRTHDHCITNPSPSSLSHPPRRCWIVFLPIYTLPL